MESPQTDEDGSKCKDAPMLDNEELLQDRATPSRGLTALGLATVAKVDASREVVPGMFPNCTGVLTAS